MKMKIKINLFLLFCLIVCIVSCTKDKTSVCDIDPSFAVDVQPFFDMYCVTCHESNSASGGVVLNDYNAVYNHINSSISEIEQGTMPPYGMPSPTTSEKDSILEILNCWVSMGKKDN